MILPFYVMLMLPFWLTGAIIYPSTATQEGDGI